MINRVNFSFLIICVEIEICDYKHINYYYTSAIRDTMFIHLSYLSFKPIMKEQLSYY